MTKKISLFLVLILSVMTFGLIGSNQPIKADTQTTTVTLHKVLFGFGDMPAERENHGKPNAAYDDHERLPGVTFEVYDVTADFHTLISAPKNLTHEEAQKILAESGPDGSPIATKVTDENGEATFDLDYPEGTNAAYLFHERSRPEGISEQTSDFVVVLPFSNLAGKRLDHIHLYPKNESEKVPVVKEVIGDVSYEIGEPIAYEIKTKVPSHPGVYSSFRISDSADSVLLFDVDSLVVTIGDTSVTDIYELESKTNGFVLDFDIDQLKNFSNQEVIVRYDMSLSAEAIPDVNYFNEASVVYDNQISIDQDLVRTGGYRFIKVDLRDETRALADAHFTLRNEEGNYLVAENGNYTWISDREDATRLISDDDGALEVIGLKYGNYSLEEVKAPTGYVLSDTAIPFEVMNGTYGPRAVMNIVNQPVRPTLPITGGKVPPAPEAPETPARPRLPITRGEERPRLPRTGEMNNVIFSVIGVIFIISALLILYSKKGKRGTTNEKND